MHFGLARAGLGAPSFDFHLCLCPVILRTPYGGIMFFARWKIYLSNPLIVIKFLSFHYFLRSLDFHRFLKGGGGSCRRQGKSAAPGWARVW